MNELKSYTEYAVSTPTADFVIGFDFNYGEDAVNVTVDDVPATEAGYTVVYLNETTIRLSPSVPSGVVRLQRETDIDQTDHAYRAGAKFIAQTMDENFEQLRHSQQEVRDGFSKLSTDTNEIIEGLDAALELAQDAAQDAQDAAVIAQGAADTVNTIIVGGKVGASNVLDASGETQQQVNYNGGSKWHSRVGGYLKNERVVLDNGDIVKSAINANTNNPNTNMAGWELDRPSVILNPADLLSLPNPYTGQRAFVTSLQKCYTYSLGNLSVENGVTVVGDWEMDIQDSYWASWFADQDTPVDQSLKLQAAHDYATSKDRPFIIDGNYHVEANQSYLSIDNNAFIIRDYSKVTWLPNAKLTQINQNKNQSNLVLMMRTKGATVIKPKGVGDRLDNLALGSHTSEAQGYGYGLAVYETDGCLVYEPDFSQNHGDNIYIGKPWGSSESVQPKDTVIVRPRVSHARRNCISFTAWENVKIIDPIMIRGGDSDGIKGCFPKACLDIELENAAGFPSSQGINGLITNPKCYDSDNGIFFYCASDNVSYDVAITGVSTFQNITTVAMGAYYSGLNCTGKVYVENVDIIGSPYIDLSLGWHKSGVPLYINRFEPRRGSVLISSLLNGTYSTNTLGNVTISNLITRSASSFIYDVGDTTSVNGHSNIVIDGYKFLSPQDSSGISVYTNDAATQAKFGADTFIDSKDQYVYYGFSTDTRKKPNKIWFDPSIDSGTYITINSSGDYRELTIGLLYDTNNIGQGCNIQGLNLDIGGVTKTVASTSTRGGWIKFKNKSGGRTRIIDSYGTWTFS